MPSAIAVFRALAIASFIAGASAQNTSTGTAAVASAAATALTLSPTSSVKGRAFDRIAIFYLENTDATEAFNDPNLQALQKQGITLTNYNAVTHPSQPNYMAAAGGDYFGLDNDNFQRVPADVSTLADILEDKGISWGAYMEDMPYSGFEGIAWKRKSANDYVRKHNPFVIYDSVANNKDRLAVVKNFTMFVKDLSNNQLPQYMFIVANMTNDGHDTSVATAGAWVRSFVEPLLTDPHFANNTLILITFDEDETYSDRNTVYGLLLGDAVPTALQGTSDATYYNHYSQISTVEFNWNTHTLGRWDVGANVFAFATGNDSCNAPVAWTGPPSFDSMYFNESYPGPLHSSDNSSPWPAPNVNITKCGRSVLPQIVTAWEGQQQNTYYTSSVEIPDGLNPPTFQGANSFKRSCAF